MQRKCVLKFNLENHFDGPSLTIQRGPFKERMEHEENQSLEDSMQRFRNEAAEVRALFAFQALAESSSAQVRPFLIF